jgi:hypothetical protein
VAVVLLSGADHGAAAAALAAAACLLTACAATPADRTAAGPVATRPPPAASFHSLRTVEAPAAPARVSIPQIGVDAVVAQVHQLADGTIDVPRTWEDVGWYADGPRPGEPGPAVLLGHVDSRSGPAVFARLDELHRGSAVQVTGADRRVRQFVVERVERFPKTAFPRDEVYLPTLRREVRLVTCGGRFDRATGHYVDNVIAFAAADP